MTISPTRRALLAASPLPLGAPALAKSPEFWADQGVGRSFTLDASRYVNPVPRGAAGPLGADALAAHDQSAGMAMLNAAVAALLADVKASLTINQYFRGLVCVVWPDGVIPLAKTVVLDVARVAFLTRAPGSTVFARVGGDYGDCLVLRDRHIDPNLVGDTHLDLFAAIDLTASSGGALVRLQRLERATVDAIRTQNGYRGLEVEGCTNTTIRNVIAKADASFGGAPGTGRGTFRHGSACLAFTGAPGTVNSGIQVEGGTFAGDDPDHRYVEDAILVESADVIQFAATYCGAARRADFHMHAAAGRAVQGIQTSAMRFDNACRFNILVSGATDLALGDCDIAGKCFAPDQSHLYIDSPGFAGGRFALSCVGAGREAVVLKGTDTEVTGQFRGIGVAMPTERACSGVWIGNSKNRLIGSQVHGDAPRSLAYAVEIALPQSGCAAQTSHLLPGGACIAGVSYNDGSFDTTGTTANTAGRPTFATDPHAARTVPLAITAPLP